MSKKTRIVIAAALLTLFTVASVSAAVYKKGSSGSVVVKIQTKLKNWGYYTGAVDGVYGAGTESAVKRFQKKNGLTADGICGPATLAAMGISSGGSGSGDLYLLARIISAEARGEPYVGQVAVGAVVLNRVKLASFPDTIAGVIYQKGAFSALSDGQFDKPISDSAWNAARDALNGWDPTGGAIYYYNPQKTTSKWIYTRPVLVTIGSHVFAK